MENNIMAIVGAFIGIAIMLGIGIQILGNAVQDCTQLDGYDATGGGVHTGWAAQCESNNLQTQNSYGLLVIILIVIAAVAILSVVKML